MTRATPTPPTQIIATKGELRLALDRGPYDPEVSGVARAIAFYLDAVESGTRRSRPRPYGREAAEAIASEPGPFALVEVSARRAASIDEVHRRNGDALAHKPKELLAEAARTSRSRNAEMDLGFALSPERAKVSASRAEIEDALSDAPSTPVGRLLEAASQAVRQPQWRRSHEKGFAHTGFDANGRHGLQSLLRTFGAGERRAVIFDASAMEKILRDHPEGQLLREIAARRASEAERRRAVAIADATRRPAPETIAPTR